MLAYRLATEALAQTAVAVSSAHALLRVRWQPPRTNDPWLASSRQTFFYP